MMNPSALFRFSLVALCFFALTCFETHAQSPVPASANVVAQVLQPFLDNHNIAGAVTLVASKDKVLSLEAIGYSDLSVRTPMQTDNLFFIASQTKTMTAVAVMMLVDAGKLKLDDAVEKYLPEFKDQWVAVEKDDDHVLLKKPAHPITVKNLLSHTSGLGNRAPMDHPTEDQLPLRTAVQGYAMMPLMTEPGSEYCYSNSGINTAGRIVEVVSGMPYEQFMAKRLFEPLGMKDTTFGPNEEQLKRLAKSYRPNADKTNLEETIVQSLRYPLSDRRRYPVPSAGLFSTATDLARFCQMLLAGGVFDGKRYLSEDSVRQMASKQTSDSIAMNYGLGMSVNMGTHGAFGHGGAHRTQMTLYPKEQLVTIYMTQIQMIQEKDSFRNADIYNGKIPVAFEKAVMKTFAPQSPRSK